MYKDMEIFLESCKKVLKNMCYKLLSHIKSYLCWFNITFSRKQFDKKRKRKNNVFNFIRNKRDRIKRFKKGLVDIELKLNALKASLVKRLIDISNVISRLLNGY